MWGAVTVVVAAALALCDEGPPELRLPVGQSGTGDIVFEGEEDRVAVDLLAGMKLTLTARPSKKSLLRCGADLLDPAETVVTVEPKLRKESKGVVTLKSVPISATGTYFAAVRGTSAGPLGAYDLLAAAKAPPKPPKRTGSVPSDGVAEFTVDALAGSLLTVVVTAAKGSGLRPHIDAILGPGDIDVDLTSAVIKKRETATLASVSKVPLTAFGTWRVQVSGVLGSAGNFTATTTLKFPKAPKAKRDFRGASGGEAGAGEPQSIEVLPVTAPLAAGATRKFVARGTYADGRTRDLSRVVTWGVRNRSAATISATAPAGTVAGVAAGGTTVQAWTGRTRAREALVLVGGATVAGVDVVPAGAKLAAGDAIRLQARATMAGATADAATADVTDAADWVQTGTALASIAGGRAVGASISTSQVTATVGGVESAAASVEVTGRRVVRISVAPAYAELTAGSPSRTFVATAEFSDATSADVTAMCTFASDRVGAASMTGATATRVADGTAGIRATLDGVTSRPSVVNSGPVAMTSISVSGGTSVTLGGELDLTAAGTFADGGTRDVTEACAWASGAAATATVSNAPATRGRVAGVAVNASPARISASLTVKATPRSAFVDVTCGTAATKSLRIVPAVTTVALGSAVTFRAWATATDGTESDVTGTSTWTTSNPSAATVASGVVTGTADGGAAISATFSGRTARAVVLAGTGRMTGVTLSTADTDAEVGEAATYTALATFEPSAGGDPPAQVAAEESLFLASPLVAEPAAGGSVTARRAGTSQVLAASGGFASAELTFTANPPVARTLTTFPQVGLVALAGADLQFAAQVRRSDGFVTDQAANSTWTSLSPSFITVGATGLAHAVAKGSSTIRAQFDGLQDDALATALGDPPTLAAVSPATVLRGQSGVTFTLTGSALDGLSPQVTISGTGVSVASGPNPVAGGAQATVVLDVAANATTGPRDVTYTTLVGSSTKTSAFQIVVPAPTVTSVAPSNAAIPSASTTITVNGTGFEMGDTFTIGAATGVSLSGATRTSATTMTGNVAVTGAASIGRVSVVVQQSAANGGATATLANALKIGGPDPTVASVSPAFMIPGQSGTQTVTVQGSNFLSGITIALRNVPSGVTASNATRVSSSVITFQVTAPASASYGPIDLDLTNPGDLTSTFDDLFAVAPRDPTISSSSVVSLARGVAGVDVIVRGTNFRPGATISASGNGVTFSSVTVVDAETITAKAAATSGAALGARDLTVAHAASEGGRGATRRNALAVVSAAPTVASVAPGKLGRTGAGGATVRVPVKVTGSDISTGATVSVTRSGGSGLTVVAGSTLVVSSTVLRFDLDVGPTTTTGSWDVKITNPSGVGDSGTSGASALEIVSETTLAVNRVTPSSGGARGGERVAVQGSGFVRGCRVEFGGEKALNVQVTDQSTLVCTVPAPGNPSSAGATTVSTAVATEVDVKVTNNPGGSATSATLAKGWAYGPDTSNFVVASSIPADGSTGVKQNLKSAVLRLSGAANTATASFAGSTQGTHCYWFEGGSFVVSSQTGGFGADRRFLVYSRTGGGNLPINSAGTYVLEVPTAVKSSSGRALTPVNLAAAGNRDQWGFTLTTSTDTTAPTISTRVPASSATGVATTTAASVTFNEPVDPLTITTSSVQLKQGATVLNCQVTLSDDITTVTLTPTEELAKNTTYTVSLGANVADLFGNAISATTWTFTTQASDMTAPTIDAVVLADLPDSVDGSSTYLPGRDTVPGSGTHESAGSATAFDSYLPTSGWSVRVTYSDTGDGIDPSTFSAKSNVALGGGATAVGAELASRFVVTATGATWTVGASDAFPAQDDVTLTFTVSDKAGKSGTSVITFDTVGKDTTVAAAAGGDHDPFDTREVWVLRFDRDVYTATFSTSGATQQVTTTGASNGVADVEEALRICGLWSASMTTAAAATTNGPSTGTNSIVLRLFQERVRATVRARFGVDEDGTHGTDAADIEFLLPGELGSLATAPTLATATNSNTGNAWSEIDIGGDTAPNASTTGAYTTVGQAYFDQRNRRREANLNSGSSNTTNNNGIFCINLFKYSMNDGSGTRWRTRVLDGFQAAKGGTPVGEGSLDDDVLAGAFDRTSGSNSQAMNDRWDAIMDAIEAAAMSVSGTLAHEIGHSIGLVPDGAPKTGLFGNAHHSNGFTEATTGSENTSHHLDFLGNDTMAPASSTDDSTATGSDLQRFNPLDANFLRARQVQDEGK